MMPEEVRDIAAKGVLTGWHGKEVRFPFDCLWLAVVNAKDGLEGQQKPREKKSLWMDG
jgi:hypothetical protein